MIASVINGCNRGIIVASIIYCTKQFSKLNFSLLSKSVALAMEMIAINSSLVTEILIMYFLYKNVYQNIYINITYEKIFFLSDIAANITHLKQKKYLLLSTLKELSK